MTQMLQKDFSHSQGRMDDNQRLLTAAGMQALYTRIQNLSKGGGQLEVNITAWWRGSLRWARNRVSLASDQRDVQIMISRQKDAGYGGVRINQIDDASLATAVRAAERRMNISGTYIYIPFHGKRLMNLPLPYPETAIWSEVTYQVTSAQRAHLAQALTNGAEDKQLLSAGYLEMYAYEQQNFGEHLSIWEDQGWRPSHEPPQGQGGARTARDDGYVRHTQAQCSLTVRHPKGLGSGWAGLSSYDWSAIDGPVLATRALDKCVASLNPVAVEPGRFTVILEPQAVYTFANILVGAMYDRNSNENLHGQDVFSDDVDPTIGLRMTKLGQVIMDERITIAHDPMDPRLGVLPTRGLAPVTWIKNGKLVNLSYERDNYALPKLRENVPTMHRTSFTMSGGTTSMEEMIATTKRGLLVSRFSGMTLVQRQSLLSTGVTRDGLFLIEQGKLTKAVKNMRFTDSPLFVFNQVQQLGTPMPIFRPENNYLASAVVPPIKSEDFAFTSTIDAI